MATQNQSVVQEPTPTVAAAPVAQEPTPTVAAAPVTQEPAPTAAAPVAQEPAPTATAAPVVQEPLVAKMIVLCAAFEIREVSLPALLDYIAEKGWRA